MAHHIETLEQARVEIQSRRDSFAAFAQGARKQMAQFEGSADAYDNAVQYLDGLLSQIPPPEEVPPDA